MTAADFQAAVRHNPINTALLARLPALQLPQCHLVAGCLFQALWNARSGRQANWGVKDYDVFYFDDSDLSWEAEDAVIQRARLGPVHTKTRSRSPDAGCTARREVQ